nr:MAG TPA_asm: hypothetical protein [Caudoviricetes sp.]
MRRCRAGRSRQPHLRPGLPGAGRACMKIPPL